MSQQQTNISSCGKYDRKKKMTKPWTSYNLYNKTKRHGNKKLEQIIKKRIIKLCIFKSFNPRKVDYVNFTNSQPLMCVTVLIGWAEGGASMFISTLRLKTFLRANIKESLGISKQNLLILRLEIEDNVSFEERK